MNKQILNRLEDSINTLNAINKGINNKTLYEAQVIRQCDNLIKNIKELKPLLRVEARKQDNTDKPAISYMDTLT